MKAVIIFFLTVFFSQAATGWLPVKHSKTEFRLLAKGDSNINTLNDLVVEGQLLGVNALKNNLHFAGLFSLGNEHNDSKLGASLKYKLNKFFSISALGDLSHSKSLGAEFLLNGDFELDSLSLLPFLKITHKQIASVGIVIYIDIDDVLFSLGGEYSPPLFEKSPHRFTLLFGTGLI